MGATSPNRFTSAFPRRKLHLSESGHDLKLAYPNLVRLTGTTNLTLNGTTVPGPVFRFVSYTQRNPEAMSRLQTEAGTNESSDARILRPRRCVS
jgi:hypothetical protein